MVFREKREAVNEINRIFDRIEVEGRNEVFLSLKNKSDLLDELDEIFDKYPFGELTGLIVAVKDNIDVLGFPTTAACPSYAYTPINDAAAVVELKKAGALIIGKTNLDQFATGLVGTRSPFGAVRDAINPERISGGSSSGSAVAVSMGFADASLGTDTAGSGRIPAALQGVVGIKPTLGTVSSEGVVPACKSYDTISVFAKELALARLVTKVIARSGSRPAASGLKENLPQSPVIAVPAALPELNDSWKAAFGKAKTRLRDQGFVVREIDLSESLEAAKMLYESALVSERAEAVGKFISNETSNENLDPSVKTIVLNAAGYSGSETLSAQRELVERRDKALAAWSDCDALMIPTAPFHPDIATVEADPIGVNAKMGTYTNFCNLFDLSAIAIPAGEVPDGGSLGSEKPAHFGVTFVGMALEDDKIGKVADRFQGINSEPVGWLAAQCQNELISVGVFGLHLSGQTLNGQLLDLGGYLQGKIATSPEYKLFELATDPAKPGLSGKYRSGGHSILGEEWKLSPLGFSNFISALPDPMTIGRIRLEDGREILGFSFQPSALEGAKDISSFGGWKEYLQEMAVSQPQPAKVPADR